MALSHFSIACWTLLPKTSSPISSTGTSFMRRAAFALLEALPARTFAIALVDEPDTFTLGLVLDRAEMTPPFLIVRAAHDHQIDGLAQQRRFPDETTKTNRFEV